MWEPCTYFTSYPQVLKMALMASLVYIVTLIIHFFALLPHLFTHKCAHVLDVGLMGHLFIRYITEAPTDSGQRGALSVCSVCMTVCGCMCAGGVL